MAHVPLTRETLPDFRARLNQIQPASQRLWGSMTAERAVCHLARAFEISLGEAGIPDKSNWFTRTILPHIILRAPWPKAKIKAPPEFIVEEAQDLDTERTHLLAIAERFTEMLDRDPNACTLSPFLGTKPLKFWARVHGKHLDHHLRQFGA